MSPVDVVADREAVVEHGIYLYCLAPPESVPAIHALTEAEAIGLDGMHPVFPLEYKGIVAVIGPVALADFHDENLRQLEWVGPRAWRHEAIVETIMKTWSVIPVKFGTIFRSITSLTLFLAPHRELILRALEEVRHKAEWTVRGYLDEAAAKQRAAERSHAVRSRLEALSSLPGTRYFQQKQLDALIESEICVWIENAAQEVYKALAAPDTEAIGVKHPLSAAREPKQRMVFSGSFLVPHSALPRFQAKVVEQEKNFRADGLTLELQGPWPPHNFCPALARSK